MISENTARLTGTGHARGDVSSSAIGRALRFVVRFPDQDHGPDQLALPFADGSTLVISRSGMVLTSGGQQRILAKEADQFAFALQFDRDAVEVQVPGSPRWVPIAKPAKELLMSWDVLANRSIDIRVRVVPVRSRR